MFGNDLIQLVSDFLVECCTRLSFEQMEDTLTMLNFAVTVYKRDSL